MRWGRKEREDLVAKAAKAVLECQDGASLFLLAYAGARSTRPDAGLLWSDLAAVIHRVCRGDSPACGACPHNLAATLYGRMAEHGKVSEWETEWGIADEVRVHEEIHCCPCPHWGWKE